MPRSSTTFQKGKPPGPGRPKMTEDEKRLARIRRAENYDFKQACREMLPIATDQLLAELDKRKFKDAKLLAVIETLRDSVHGRPAQAITGAGGGPLVVSFAELLAKVDGAKDEKI